MFEDKLQKAKESFTFDDVLLVPSRTSVEPKNADVSTKFSRNIKLKIPIISSPMDTVTEVEMAIAMARSGGLGIVHRNLTANSQMNMVAAVKRAESLKIRNVLTVEPGTSIKDARTLMQEKHVAGLPVISSGKLIGIVTKRDIALVDDSKKKVEDVMVRDVIYARENISMDEAQQILYENRIEKLPLVDNSGRVVGLITAKDIVTRQKFPDASRDEEGKLLVGAAIGPFDVERAKILEKAGADVIVIDTAHCDNQNVLDSIKKIRKELSVDLVAGNIATGKAAQDLISLDVDGLRVGIGPGSICTTRIIAGVGVPQLTAISEVAEVASQHGIPVVGDGGVRFSGDIVKAIAAGADSVMLGSLLAGTEESPGMEMILNGRKYKSYRGMGSIGAIQSGLSDRYAKLGSSKFVAEGVEAAVPFRGKVEEVLFQLIGGLKSGMGYVGAKDITALKTETSFVRISPNGLKESHPHDIKIMIEPPNYQLFQI
ncbi:MAG: IMP dehydrogenase [Thermoplasmata archaeon]